MARTWLSVKVIDEILLTFALRFERFATKFASVSVIETVLTELFAIVLEKDDIETAVTLSEYAPFIREIAFESFVN